MRKVSLYVAALFTAFTLTAIPHGAHAQATPTATATPISCGGGSFICNTGADQPGNEEGWLGISGGNINSIAIDKSNAVTCCSGTFGALVVDASPGASPTPSYGYVLGTAHVFARNGGARTNEEIVQPGLTDTGCWQDDTDTVAKLTKSTPLKYKGAKNELDAAIATVVAAPLTPNGPLVPGVRQDGAILNIGQLSNVPFPYDQITDGLPVMKMGRTTCVTTGRIDAFDATGLVNYDGTCGAASSGTATFDHQVLVFGEDLSSGNSCTFADKGDSGAIVVTNDFSCPQAIGMVFAGASGTGPDTGGTIIAINPMTTTTNIIGVPTNNGVLDKFKVKLVGQTCTPSPLERRLNGASMPAHVSPALRASIEAVRSVKRAKAPYMLKRKGVVAIGIGSGVTPESASLAVYLTDDTPAVRQWVQKQVPGTNVKFRTIKRKFKAL